MSSHTLKYQPLYSQEELQTANQLLPFRFGALNLTAANILQVLANHLSNYIYTYIAQQLSAKLRKVCVFIVLSIM